jgi:hypothetical protein
MRGYARKSESDWKNVKRLCTEIKHLAKLAKKFINWTPPE